MSNYQVTARNFSTSSENRIHSDEIAKKFGFKGALVPGVAVYGHLVWPLVDQYGVDWLSQSVDSLRLIKPAYHGDALTVSLASEASGQSVQCHNTAGELLATLDSQADVPAAEHLGALNGDTHKRSGRVEIAWDNVIPGEVFPEFEFEFTAEENARYTSEVADNNPLYAEYVHPHLLCSLANTTLTTEYVMPTWIHVGSETRRRAVLKVGDTITVRAVTLDKWQKKGHEFIRLWVTYWRGDELTTDILHTAIFKVAS